jgi:TonB-dependent SusC/RagA subfamily outer membrane receptor
MKKYIHILLLMLLPVTLTGAGNTGFSTTLQKRLGSYIQEYPQEKIYVQTDKTYYTPSEKIWYKPFLTDANGNKSSSISEIFYVELIDPWGNVIEKHDHKTDYMGAASAGSFLLKKDCAGGIYKLRAYTNWMKNWGEAAFFTKEITVQKVITPRLLLKLDFEKKAYGAGDEVSAKLKVTDLNDRKTTGSAAKSTVRIGGIAVQTLENETAGGETTIRFHLPQDLHTADGILQIVVTDKGTEESITRSIPIVLNKINIAFFPEGGDMVEGVPAKVAFEALNEFGKGADVSGNIVDEKGKTVASFESFHLGMGAVSFTPQPGGQYFAKITRPQGDNTLHPLPQALKSGYTLHLQFKIQHLLKWKVYVPEDETVILVGQSNGKLYYNRQLTLRKGVNKVDVNVKAFPAGTAVFTLFNGENREVCELLVFLNADKGLNIKIEPNEEIYEPGDKAYINITTTDKDGNPISASIGLAVVDEQLLTLADDKQDNIVSYLLFSSELKGRIHEPYFYVDPTEPKAAEALDYLMLTHGWRRFTWEEVLKPVMQPTEPPEKKEQGIYGYVLDKNGKPVAAEVFLIEYDKISALQTTSNGCFVFHNINPYCRQFITTQLPNQVYLFKGKPVIAPIIDSTALTGEEYTTTANERKLERKVGKNELPRLKSGDEVFYSYSMEQMPAFPGRGIKGKLNKNGDIELDEFVVVGYGRLRKSDLTGAIGTIREDRLLESVTTSIDHALQGRVAGVSVTESGTPGNDGTSVRIRGTSSLSGNNEPLYVINGVPVENPKDLSMNPKDIISMEVWKNAPATAIYGSRAVNGVIMIRTKTRFYNNRSSSETPRYGGMYAVSGKPHREYYRSYDFYPDEENGKGDKTTVYWNDDVETDKNGKATVYFKNNKYSSAFRITAEGLSATTGLIGSNTKRIVVRKSFSLDAKTPLFAAVGNVIKIPVMAKNNTGNTLSAVINGIQINYDPKTIKIPPHESVTVYFTQKVTDNNQLNLEFWGETDKYADKIRCSVPVRQVYFPIQYSFSGRDAGQTQTLELPEYVDGTLQAEAVCYTSPLDELMDGVESIFREPHGCFEQVSSSTFPNIFALQLLKAMRLHQSSLPKAMQYLESGYKKLAAYEVKGGGFEWYGGSPAHEVLSAYGLVEFYEMSKVYDKVNKDMMERTRQFILGRRDGKGGFKQNNGKYGFSGAPQNVNNAYIVYALAETQNGKEIEKEYRTALKEALESKDIYRMALIANAAYSMGDLENYNSLLSLFKEYSLEGDFSKMKVEATIVRSYGENARREAVAFWLLALLKKDKDNIDVTLVDECLAFINKGRQRGWFGSTQTTSICLQALTKYAEFLSNQKIEGSLCVNVNDNTNCTRLYGSKARIDLAKTLKKGTNKIDLKFTDTEQIYPYAVNITWQSKTPPTSKLCPLKLATTLASPTVKVNETVRLNVTLQNTHNEGKPMSVAIIGIPGGLSLQPWQLKELQEKEVFDFYEIIDDNLVVYYREFGPSETKTINLDLKAEVPGEYTGIASSAYLYYMNEHKYWINGLSVKIAP